MSVCIVWHWSNHNLSQSSSVTVLYFSIFLNASSTDSCRSIVRASGDWVTYWLSDFMARLCSTLSIVARRSPMLSAGSVSGPPHINWYWWHNIGYPLSVAEHSLCTAPWSGTLCRTTSAHSRTKNPIDWAWKPGFFLGTSMFSALETFVAIALYKSTFIIPYHTM